MKFKVGQKVVGTPALVKEWGIQDGQLPLGVVATILSINSKETPSISVQWTDPHHDFLDHNSYHEDQLQPYIADKLDLI